MRLTNSTSKASWLNAFVVKLSDMGQPFHQENPGQMISMNTRALLTLTLLPGVGQTLTTRCIETFGNAQTVLQQTPSDLQRIKGISSRLAQSIAGANRNQKLMDQVDAECDRIASTNVQLLAFDDPAYPASLRHIPDPPHLLWVKGDYLEQDALALAMVGSRKCTLYGREQADRFAYLASQAGLCVVSGGAYGIDAAAHQATLRAGGRTIAVIGSGLDNPYPRDHVQLFEQIAEQGVLMSELPMNTPPAATNFPRRNRIISGLSMGTLVVEAAKRSGALITARLCVEEHGRELMAIPGRIDSNASAGCNQIIRDGSAALVTSIEDVLNQLGEAGELLKATSPAAEPTPSLFEHNLTAEQQQIVHALQQPRNLDEIVSHTGLPANVAQSELTMLELRGTVKRESGLFVLKK